MCSSLGADRVLDGARAALAQRDDGARCRLLRGGCYGLCELSPNVVVRRISSGASLPDVDADRLSLTEGAGETVYSCMTPADVARALQAHLEEDLPVTELTRRAREIERAPKSGIAARLRALRAKRRALGDDE